MFYIAFCFVMAVIMFLFGIWFYKSKGKAAKFLSGYNMKSAEAAKKREQISLFPLLKNPYFTRLSD